MTIFNLSKLFRASALLLMGLMLMMPASGQEIFLGPKFGGNLMMLKNTDFDETEGITSFGGHAGLFLEVRMKMISVQADLLYNYDRFEGILNTFDTKLTYGRVTLPVVFKMYPSGHGFNIQVGGQVGYLVHGNSQQTDGQNFDDTFDITNTTNTPDASFIAGLGFDFHAVSLTARYIFGATDFPNTEEIMSGPQLGIGFVAFRGSQLGKGIPKSKKSKFKAPKGKKVKGKKSAGRKTKRKR